MENNDGTSRDNPSLERKPGQTPMFAYDRELDLSSWQTTLREQLREKLMLDSFEHQQLKYSLERREQTDRYESARIEIRTTEDERVPGYVLRPNHVEAPYPVMICLQGHTPGMYLSLGETRSDQDEELLEGGRDLAIQAVRHGWAAVVIEQKGFGERSVDGLECNDLALQELLKGKTLLGQRVLDVKRALDVVETQSDLNDDRIGCLGHSAGGTTGFFAACLDSRIRLTVTSCSFCTYERSWLKHPHCACGYVPGLLDVADMSDLAGLIAPRSLCIVAGRDDDIADIEGVRDGFERARIIFEDAGRPKNVRLIEGDGGHRFYPEEAWSAIEAFS